MDKYECIVLVVFCIIVLIILCFTLFLSIYRVKNSKYKRIGDNERAEIIAEIIEYRDSHNNLNKCEINTLNDLIRYIK